MKKHDPKQQKADVSRRDIFRGGLGAAALVTLGALDPNKAVASELGERGLVLKMPGLRQRVAAFFEEVHGSARLRRTFIDNPGQLVIDRFFPGQAERVAEQSVSNANRFLFSALANDEFRTWAEGYQANLLARMEAGEITAETLDKGRILQDTARALSEMGDPNLILSLLNQPSGGGDVDDPDRQKEIFTIETAVAIVAVAVLVLVISLIDITPVVDPKEGPVAVALSSSELRGLSEQLIRHAEGLDRAGALADPEAAL